MFIKFNYDSDAKKKRFLLGPDCMQVTCESLKITSWKQLTMTKRKCFQFLFKKMNHTKKQKDAT